MASQNHRDARGLAVIAAALLLFAAVILAGVWSPAPAPPPRPEPPVPAAEPAGDLPRGTPIEGRRDRSGAENYGYEPDPAATQEFLRSLPRPTIRDAGPDLFRGDNTPRLLYRSIVKAYYHFSRGGQWRCSHQGIGDCVGHGNAQAVDAHTAVLWELGLIDQWKPASSEAIYGGSRCEARGRSFGGWSDGSYGAAAAKWLKEWGVVHRERYALPGLEVDLTTYSEDRAKEWGAYGCGGQRDNGQLDAHAKQFPVRSVALVRNFAEAAAAIRSGYAVAVCSGQGFAKQRDAQGFAAAVGSWAHCMCFLGVRSDRPGLLCLNSWGPTWISGPKWPEDQPDGSFWVDERVVDRMLSGGDSFAMSGFEGFPFRKLNHGDWVSAEPPQLPHGPFPAPEPETQYALAP